MLGNYNSDELPYYRELTEAEEKVNFEAIQKFLEKNGNDFEESAKKELTAYIEHVAANPDEEIKLPDSYVKLVETTYKTAYNYGKLSTANEQSLPAPSTKKEQREHVKRYVDLVTEMQTSDIELMIKEARVKAPLNLADEDDVVNSVISNLILASAAAWVLKVVLGTKGTISSQGMNDGINDTFDKFGEGKDAVYQWSSVMEPSTCATCRALDAKTLSQDQWRVRTQDAPKHINCKCRWVQVIKMADDYELPDVTGINEDFMNELEVLRTTPKQQLIDSGYLANGVTKVEAESFMMYQGIYYQEINKHFRFNTPISQEALKAATRIDNVIARNALASNIRLYRGLGFDEAIGVGDQLSELAFFSSSTSEVIGRSFALSSDGKYKYLFKFTTPEGLNAASMNSILPNSALSYEKEMLLGRNKSYIIKSMGKPDDNGIIDVEIALVDKAGKELADAQVPHVITQEEIDAADKVAGVYGETEPTPEQLAMSRDKILSNNRGIKVTRPDGTTFTT